jgi:hypothetical protein
MDDWRGVDVRWLRDRASHITWLASHIADQKAHEALVALAEDYERQASEIEGLLAAD